MQPLHWKPVDMLGDDLVYGFQPSHVQADQGRMPVLFLRNAEPETWDSLAAMFYEDGFTALYAQSVNEDSTDAALDLADTIEQLLHLHHPEHERLIIVGCDVGGMLGRRYVMYGGYERVSFLFTLGSSHRYSPLAYLRATIFEPNAESDEPPPVAVPRLEDTMVVNILGESVGADFDLMAQGIYLPEALNMSLPLGREALCRDVLTYEAIRRYLSDALWLVTVYLLSLDMRKAKEDSRTGPFCFEIERRRTPFDGVFRVPVGVRHDFETPPLLTTIPFPLSAEGRAVTIEFRIRDLAQVKTGPLSASPASRRKLLASLHTPLRDGVVNEQTLQDNLGSEIRIQVICARSVPIL